MAGRHTMSDMGPDSAQIAKNRIPRTMSVWGLTPEARMVLPAFMSPRPILVRGPKGCVSKDGRCFC